MRTRGVIVFIALSAMLLGLSIIAAAVSFYEEGLTSNSAAWVQAAGSIAAIAGAGWLFLSETIIRRRERRAVGEEVAWGVRFALTNAQVEARTIAFELIDEALLQNENPRRHWLLRSENCQNVLRVYAERTDHIHPALIHLASNGMLLLKQLDMDIDTALSFFERGQRPSLGVAADIAWYEAHFEKLIQELDARMSAVRQALDEGGDFLPIRNWNVS